MIKKNVTVRLDDETKNKIKELQKLLATQQINNKCTVTDVIQYCINKIHEKEISNVE